MWRVFERNLLQDNWCNGSWELASTQSLACREQDRAPWNRTKIPNTPFRQRHPFFQRICLNDGCGGSLAFRTPLESAVGDVDNDGDLEIVVFASPEAQDSSDGRKSILMHIFNADGTELPGFAPEQSWVRLYYPRLSRLN